jgi:CRP-like cAMP-binding protein
MYGESAYLFQGLSDTTRKKLLGIEREVTYGPGDFLFREDESATNFFILNKGRIRLRVGRKPLLAHVASSVGDIIGWSSLVGNATYTASAECLTSTKVLQIEKHQLDQVLGEDPVSGMKFFQHLAALVGRRLVRSYRAATGGQGERDPLPRAQQR